MNDLMEILREWVRAEINAAIADSQEGSDGYYGSGYAENEAADKLFLQVKQRLKESLKE